MSLQRIFSLANELEREVARHLAVSPTDYRALSMLMQSGPLTVGELGDSIGASYATTTALANRLERAGHLHRARVETDHRKVLLSVDAGTARRVIALMGDAMDAAISYVDRLPEPDAAAVTAFTSALTDTLAHHLSALSPTPTPVSLEAADDTHRKER